MKHASAFALAFLAVLEASAFQRLSDRDIYDISPAAPEPGATTVKVDLGSSALPLAPGRLVRAFVIHARSGDRWFAAPEIEPSKNGSSVYIPLESFKGFSGAAESISTVRVSAWGALVSSHKKKNAKSGTPAARAVAPRIGVVAPGFSKARVRENLGAPVAFFEETDLDAIKAFSARGGRLVVANCENPALAAFMGVKPGKWRRFDSAALASPGGAVMAKYETACGRPPAPAAGSKTVAYLFDSHMRNTGIPGAVATPRGVWYAHAVPPRSMKSGMLAAAKGCAVRGVWSAGAPLDPRGWDGMAARLAANGFNTLFMSTASPYFAQALESCRKHGIAFHAWYVAFGDTGRSPDSAKDRAKVRADVAALFRQGVDGVELDYFRYAGGALKTDEARAKGARTLTALLKTISADVAAVKKSRRGKRADLSVAVFATPQSQAGVGQNVAAWLESDLVDFVSPMCYTSSAREFAMQILANGNPSKIVPGIGTGANESRLDALSASAQMTVCAKAKLRGYSLFRLDAELAARLKAARPGKPQRGR